MNTECADKITNASIDYQQECAQAVSARETAEWEATVLLQQKLIQKSEDSNQYLHIALDVGHKLW